MSTLLLGKQDLIDNPSTRLPVCICVDVSGSMDGQPIEELNEGIQMFFDSIKNDDIAQWCAEICIITFGDTIKNPIDFGNIHRQVIPEFRAYGGTPLGEAVNTGLDLLERRKNEYSSAGVDYYQPWLVLMTDGIPNGNVEELKKSIMRTQSLIKNKKLTVFPLGIGTNADLKILSYFSGQRGAFTINNTNFKDFFSWLSQSIKEISVSSPGENVDLFEKIESLKKPWISKQG